MNFAWMHKSQYEQMKQYIFSQKMLPKNTVSLQFALFLKNEIETD